jgi:dyslexia susceptibility 1 candidate gene 1 protein
MPIVEKEFESQETESTLYISLPLHTVHASKVDVYSNELYIKINYPPYFFELDLMKTVEMDKTVVTIGEGKIKVEFVKVDQGLWNQIKYTGPDVKQRRNQAEEEALSKIAIAKEAAKIAKREKERDLVRMQIQVQQDERLRVQSIKDNELKASKLEVEDWIGDNDGVDCGIQNSSSQDTLNQIRAPAAEAKIENNRIFDD